jgi:hypothetical protein
LVLALGCQQKQDKPPEEKADTQAEATATAAALNPEIANVVQEATEQAAKGAASAPAGGNAPPPNGIVTKQQADAEAAVGSAPVLTIGSEGTAPRISLGAAIPTDERIGQLEVSVRMGPRSGLPTVQFKLKSQVSELPAAEGTQPGKQLSFEVVEATLGSSQLGQLPPGAADTIAKLKGTGFSAPLSGSVLSQGFSVTRAEGTTTDLDLLTSFAADALTSLVVAYPDKPVGKDAAWMTTSRERFGGTDVVAYRLYRLVELTGDGAVIGLSTRRHAAGGPLGLPSIADHELLEFSGTDDGQLRVMRGHWLPVEGRISQRLGAALRESSNAKDGRVQLEARTVFAFPPKPGAATDDTPEPGTTAPTGVGSPNTASGTATSSANAPPAVAPTSQKAAPTAPSPPQPAATGQTPAQP